MVDRAAAWEDLTRDSVPVGVFDPATLEARPDPAKRCLSASVRPGADPVSSVVLEMEGEIRLRDWQEPLASM